MDSEKLTPYMIYFCEVKPLIQAENSGAKPHEISKLIYEQWKSLAPEQSRGYSVLSALYADSKKSGPSSSRRKRTRDRDPKAPKAATSAYMYFSKHHRNLLKQENTDLSFGDLGKTVGAMWKAATPEEKQPFEEQAAIDKSRYLKQVGLFKKEAAALEDEAKKLKTNSISQNNDLIQGNNRIGCGGGGTNNETTSDFFVDENKNSDRFSNSIGMNAMNGTDVVVDDEEDDEDEDDEDDEDNVGDKRQSHVSSSEMHHQHPFNHLEQLDVLESLVVNEQTHSSTTLNDDERHPTSL